MLSPRIKYYWIFTALVLVLFAFPLNSFAEQPLQPSPALQTIFNQANDTYLVPPFANGTLNDAFHNAPEVFALTVGMTLQRQKQYVHTNPKYFPQYKKLQDEAVAFMKFAARYHNYVHPGDGSPLPEERMIVAFLSGLNGEMNQAFSQKFGIDPAHIDLPLMLAQVQLPKKDSNNGEMGKLQVKKDTDGLVLLGEEHSSAEDNLNGRPSSHPLKGPYVSKIICPQHSDNTNDLTYIDTNNNPKDKTRVECFYYSQILRTQVPRVEDVKHGVKFSFSSADPSRSSPFHLSERTPYTNGQRHGIAEEYGYAKGKYQVHGRKEFVEGILVRADDYKYGGKSVGYYKRSTTTYVNGKRKEVIYYDEKGSKRAHGQFNINDRAVYDTCWKADGTREDCSRWNWNNR